MASTASLEELKSIARQVPEEIATEGTLDRIDEVYAEDAIEHDPFGDHHGRAEIRESMEQVFAAFSDFSATVEDVIAEDDRVAMRVRLSGTHDGEFMGFEPTGRTFEVQNMVFTRIEDGQIAERWVQPDGFGQLAQLGVIDPPSQ